MQSHDHAIRFFEEHKAEFDASETLADFVKHFPAYAGYVGGWMEQSFRQAKTRPGVYTYHTLWLPEALTWSDLFESVYFVPQAKGGEYRAAVPDERGGYFLWSHGRAGADCRHFGGRRTLRHFEDGTVVRGVFGSTFHHLRAVPRKAVLDVWSEHMGPVSSPRAASSSDLFGCLESFRIVPRDDGFLVLAQDGASIASRYMALLPRDQAGKLADLLSPEDLYRMRAARELEAARDAGLTVDAEGRTVPALWRAEFVTVCGESYWQAEFKRAGEPEGPFYALLNGNGASCRFETRAAALDAAAIAAGFQVHK